MQPITWRIINHKFEQESAHYPWQNMVVLNSGRLYAFPILIQARLSTTIPVKYSYDSALSLLEIYPREINTYLHKDLYRNVYKSFIHNDLKVEIIKILSACE